MKFLLQVQPRKSAKTCTLARDYSGRAAHKALPLAVRDKSSILHLLLPLLMSAGKFDSIIFRFVLY